MKQENQKNGALKRFFYKNRQSLEKIRETDFDKLEKLLRDVVEREGRMTFPIPTFVLPLLVMAFILVFPTMFLLDPNYSSESNYNLRSLVNFYYPLFSMIAIFSLNQKFLVPDCIFRKHYFLYFVYNSLMIAVFSFLREVVMFLIDRTPDNTWGYFFTEYCYSSIKNHFSYWTIVSMLVLVSIVCLISVSYHLVARQFLKAFILREQSRTKVQYELDFLKNQLSPHFLFNTLNNISALIQIDSKRAENAMTELSKLLRVMLYQTADEAISLEEDVEILRMYGNLEKLRLDESFDYQFNVNVENPKLMIPPLMAMPLMENALKHSKNPKGKSFAHISIEQSGNELVFRAENSNFPRVSHSPKKSSGLGLSTFQKRLELLFPDQAEYQAYVEDGVYHSILKATLPSG